MSDNEKLTDSKKWVISLYTALLFLLIASPFMFKLVNSITSLAGVSIANYQGCPNMIGLVLHAIVFALLVRAMMLVKLPGV
jgi:hypothetical protein